MKRIVAFLLILLLYGCDISYDLYITKDLEFTERIIINGYNYDELGDDDEFIKEYMGSQIESYEKYNFIKNDSINGYFEVVLESESDTTEEFIKLDSLNKIYNDNNIYINDNGNYVFSIKRIEMTELEPYTPIEFDTFKVIIYSEKKIINSNADKIISNKYIWTMKNSEIKDIYFELTEENAFVIPSFVWFILVFLMVIPIIYLLIKKSKKSNEI